MKVIVLTKGLKQKHKDLFEKRREDFTGHRFITNEGTDYPF